MGRACAEIMAMSLKKADEIWLIARRRERLEEFCKGLPSDKAAKIRIIDGDITGPEILESINSRLSKENPRIMFLVNAAGFGKIGSVARLSRDVQERMLKLNAEALLSMTRMCIPYMAEGTGRIINFASAAAFLIRWRSDENNFKTYKYQQNLSGCQGASKYLYGIWRGRDPFHHG